MGRGFSPDGPDYSFHASSGPAQRDEALLQTYDEGSRGSLEVGETDDLIVVDIPDVRKLKRNPGLCLLDMVIWHQYGKSDESYVYIG